MGNSLRQISRLSGLAYNTVVSIIRRAGAEQQEQMLDAASPLSLETPQTEAAEVKAEVKAEVNQIETTPRLAPAQSAQK